MNIDNLINSIFGNTETIWAAIKKYALIGSKEATRMMLQMYYCLKSPDTPSLDKLIIVCGLGYQLLPKDALPTDKYSLLGLLDNGITLALAFSKVQNNVTPEINNQAETVLEQWFPSTTASRDNNPEIPLTPPFPIVIPSTEHSRCGQVDNDDLIID